MTSPRRLLLLHHSHTDVGYTELPGRIAQWHGDFIRQALEIEDPRFRWTCETLWGVQRFLAAANAAEKQAFIRAVREDRIGLSASYLNLNELPDLALLRTLAGRAEQMGRMIGMTIDSAMTADVNGYGWGFATALLDAGIGNLFTAIHTHHGMYPLGEVQRPFYWEAPDGRKLLVWSGEHYHFGNELGMVPDAVSSYLTKDECGADMIFHDHRGVAELRIPRYWEWLAERGYPFDFAPVMASGLRTDNGPPSPAILDFLDWWNEEHGDEYPVEMVTLPGFFFRLRQLDPDLPVHRGDWPDWWSDGVASEPDATRLYREAQRGLRVFDLLHARDPDLPSPFREEVEQDLALYAEHTFSHSSAMGEPWHLLVQGISTRKRGRAARALDQANDLLDGAARALGGTTLRTRTPLRYRVMNPADHQVRGIAGLGVGHYEYHERNLDGGAVVRDAGAGGPLPTELRQVPRGGEFLVPLVLAPGEERTLIVEPGSPSGDGPGRADETGLETPHLGLAFEAGRGIALLRDRLAGRDLIRPDHPHLPFTLVREITPLPPDGNVGAVRGAMVLDRRGPDVRVDTAALREVRRTEAGPVTVRAELLNDRPGTRHLEVALTAHVAEPRLDVAVRMQKESRWEPENVHVALPFSTGEDAFTLWVEKAGAIVRPRVDQLPGTLTDFYCLQAGFALTSDGYGVAVAVPDAPLLQVGPLAPGPRLLMGDPTLADDPTHLYSWTMTNYWETNFAAELGGFYEFRYSVLWGPDLADPETAIRRAADASRGFFTFRLDR